MRKGLSMDILRALATCHTGASSKRLGVLVDHDERIIATRLCAMRLDGVVVDDGVYACQCCGDTTTCWRITDAGRMRVRMASPVVACGVLDLEEA